MVAREQCVRHGAPAFIPRATTPLLQCVVNAVCTTSDPNCAQCNWANQCVRCKSWNMRVDPATKKVGGGGAAR